MASDVTFKRQVVVSKTKNIQYAQDVFKYNVQMDDLTLKIQIEAVETEFVWIPELGHSLERVGLLNRMEMILGRGISRCRR